jgi:thioredoxin-dependent peroxiredoxin
MMKTASAFLAVVCCAVFCVGGDSMLTVGTVAPAFELKDAGGTLYKLADFSNRKFVVLIFYPGDETPVCTKQLCEIRDDYTSFEKRDAVVFGVNPASGASHNKFAEKNKLQFPLLIDEKNSVAASYGTKAAIMNKRTVYVIDKAGKVIFAQRGKPSVAEILAAIPSAEPKLDLKLDAVK